MSNEIIKNLINPQTHYTIVQLIDVEMGNPNGDPASDNAPRQVSGGEGMITAVSVKRKIRDSVYKAHGNEPGYNLFVMGDQSLNSKIAEQAKDTSNSNKTVQEKMLEQYYDIRMFGAVMSTGGKDVENAGKVTGCLQFNDYISIGVIFPEHIQVTRNAVTTQKDFDKSDHKGTFGEKYIVPYGLYRGTGIYNPLTAKNNKVTEKDMEYFWESLLDLFDVNTSASRGLMTTRKLYVFAQESSPYTQAGILSSKVKVSKKSDVDIPQSFEDYDVNVLPLPESVKMYTLID